MMKKNNTLVTKKFSLSLPPPKNETFNEEKSAKRSIDSVTKKFSLSLPPPKNDTSNEEKSAKRPIDDVIDKPELVNEDINVQEKAEKSPQKKVLKRRNIAIYAEDDETE